MLLRIALILACLAIPAQAREPVDRVDRLFTSYLAQEGIPGAVLVVMRDDEVTLARAWGVADRASGSAMTGDAIQPFYSIGKQFTAALILRLVEQGRIDLDAPVGRYLPEYFGDEPELRVRHLMRHTSGLANFTRVTEVLALERAAPGTGSLSGMVNLTDRLPRRFAPGSRHSYSNSNYTTLALLAERVTGRPFDVAQREMLLRPLELAAIDECANLDRLVLSPGHNIDGTRFHLPPNLVPSFSGNGGLCGNVRSLALWTRALGTGRVIGPDLMVETRRGIPVEAGYTPPYGFGLSTLPVAGRPAFSHAGADEGWGAWAAYLPEERLTVALLANRGWLWSTELGVPLVRILLGLPPPPAISRARLTQTERAGLTGSFEDGLFEIELQAEPDRVILTNPAFGEPIELWKQPDGRFVSRLRPDTFSLRLVNGHPEFDWMEHRSYLVRRSRGPASQE